MPKKKQKVKDEALVEQTATKISVKKKSSKQSTVHVNHTSLYAGLYDREEVRRSLLEAMKETIILLQRYQKIAVMREQRILLEDQMRKLLSGMSRNLSDFKVTLPKLPKVEKPKVPKEKKREMKADLKEIDKLLEMPVRNRDIVEGGLGHEFDSLGKQLAAIDMKLKELERM
jgi:hypothetical protein